MRLPLCVTVLALLLASTATPPVCAAPVTNLMSSLGGAFDTLRGHLGSLVGNGNRRLNHLAVKKPAALLTQTRSMLAEGPAKQKSFWSGVGESKVNRRLKALEAEEAHGERINYDEYRGDPATVQLRKKAEAMLERMRNERNLLEGSGASVDSKTEIANLEKELKGLEGELLNKEAFKQSIKKWNVAGQAKTKLREHFRANGANLASTRRKLQRMEQFYDQGAATTPKPQQARPQKLWYYAPSGANEYPAGNTPASAMAKAMRQAQGPGGRLNVDPYRSQPPGPTAVGMRDAFRDEDKNRNVFYDKGIRDRHGFHYPAAFGTRSGTVDPATVDTRNGFVPPTAFGTRSGFVNPTVDTRNGFVHPATVDTRNGFANPTRPASA